MTEPSKQLDEYWEAIVAEDEQELARIESSISSVPDDLEDLSGVVDVLKQLYATRQSLKSPGARPVEIVAGSRIAQYEVVDVLGSGGMGVVYRVVQPGLNREVALKCIRQGSRNPSRAVRRFREEAATIARLKHPNIVAIHEIGEFEDNLFYTMDLVSNSTLAERLTRSPLLPVEAATMMVDIADAIQTAHDHDILHRDIKPSNILLDEDENPIVSDFGLAVDLGDDAEKSRVTRTGSIIGTPNYLSPEQATSRLDDQNASTDVYGMGATLYEMLCGRPPFASGNIWDTLRQIVENEPLPPAVLNPEVPEDLNNICLKCLEKEPSRRYVSAQAFQDDLNRFLNGEPVLAKPVTRTMRLVKWCKRNRGLAAAIIAASVLAVSLFVAVTIFAFTVNAKNREILTQREQTFDSRIMNVLNAEPGGLPAALNELVEDDEEVIERLRVEFDSQANDLNARFNIALALSGRGQFETDFLIKHLDEIHENPAACHNVVEGLQNDPAAIDQLKESMRSVSDPEAKARRIIVLAHLGALDSWQAAVEDRQDPTLRTAISHSMPKWHGDLSLLADRFADRAEEAWVWSFCEGICLLDRRALHQPTLKSVRQFLNRALQSADYTVARFSQLAIRNLFGAEAVSELPAAEDRMILPQGIRLVLIESATSELGRHNPMTLFQDYQPHPVSISKPYFIADSEVTINQFREFAFEQMGTKDNDQFRERYGLDQVASRVDNHPMCQVSWVDAVEFCNWLSAQHGLEPVYFRSDSDDANVIEQGFDWRSDFSASGFRLPTEAEFELADRNHSLTPQFFGNQRKWFDFYGIASSATTLDTLPVRSRLPNANGLHDTLGNVWEWVHDVHVAVGNEPLTDPRGPEPDFERHFRVFRGGGVATMSGVVDSESRGGDLPAARHYNIGFRVVLPVESARQLAAGR